MKISSYKINIDWKNDSFWIVCLVYVLGCTAWKGLDGTFVSILLLIFPITAYLFFNLFTEFHANSINAGRQDSFLASPGFIHVLAWIVLIIIFFMTLVSFFR